MFLDCMSIVLPTSLLVKKSIMKKKRLFQIAEFRKIKVANLALVQTLSYLKKNNLLLESVSTFIQRKQLPLNKNFKVAFKTRPNAFYQMRNENTLREAFQKKLYLCHNHLSCLSPFTPLMDWTHICCYLFKTEVAHDL